MTEKSNVEVKLTTRQSNKKIVLRNQCIPADDMGWIICGLLLLLEDAGPSRREVISLQKVDSLLVF
jgi:hypothetical protein